MRAASIRLFFEEATKVISRKDGHVIRKETVGKAHEDDRQLVPAITALRQRVVKFAHLFRDGDVDALSILRRAFGVAGD
jgi:hypothetical protein